ncbi:Rpn family recombination-promoting nuclease/putative transposase, partial [Desulfonatronovibrio magnus]|uniref:Rpn family recombination-promoting nuclease/putative transposase n=1 Tax=Desulfonatronovibrio magnus TaxID=698827 RepID=UPI0005EAFD3A
MSKKIPKAHDSFVKNILGREVYAKDFIRYYLPERITSQLDLDTLEVSSKSFVSDELKENLTDLVMSLQFKNRDLAEIYMLIEHKSNLYRLTKLQLFGYLNEAWQNKKKDELPIIIPVVFYHGKKKWNYSLEFSDMFKPPEEHYFKYIPKFEHILLEVPEINKQEIKSTIVLKVFNLTLEHIFYPDRRDRIYKAMELLFQGLQAEEAGEIFAVIVKYMLSATDLTPREVEEKVKHLPKGADTVRTTADVLEEQGYNKAILEKPQWVTEGKLEATQETLIDLATEVYGPIPGMLQVKIKSIQSVENLRALTRKIIRTKSLDEFT